MTMVEMRRVGLVVGIIVAIAIAIALIGSAVFGGWSRSSLTLWLLLLAIPMILASGGTSGSIPMGSNRVGNPFGETVMNEMLAKRVNDNRAVEMRQGPEMSWTTAIALAGVVLLVICVALTFI
ncbi:MAG: hypothetical protein AB7J35_18465 [Dehalococcoidia bacterium]